LLSRSSCLGTEHPPDTDTPAVDRYADSGFAEIACIGEKFGRIKGFRERLYMR
jgi:hypothetical protein